MTHLFTRTTLLALAASLTLPAFAAKPGGPAPTTKNPILFVHGYNSSGSIWNTMVSRFKADGWTDAELYTWSYNTSQSNANTADEIKARVDDILAKTGASKVDIITHSMGGLSSRYYTKHLGGDTQVDGWVSLGGPNHGTDTANLCYDMSCYEMRIGSEFLTNLNAGDETPGSPRYATWWSPCDSVINPDSSVSLGGAKNTKTACISHNGLVDDAGVYAQVRDFVN